MSKFATCILLPNSQPAKQEVGERGKSNVIMKFAQTLSCASTMPLVPLDIAATTTSVEAAVAVAVPY